MLTRMIFDLGDARFMYVQIYDLPACGSIKEFFLSVEVSIHGNRYGAPSLILDSMPCDEHPKDVNHDCDHF